MSLRFILRGVESGALKNNIDIELAPGKIVSVSFLVNLDLMTVHRDGMVRAANGICLGVTTL